MMASGSLCGKALAIVLQPTRDPHELMMRIPRAIFGEMVAHAKKDWPSECCGLLAGKDDLVTRIYPLDNQDGSRVSYLADPQQQYLAFKEIEDLGLELLAIYHSHPDTESYPSQMDIEKAFYSEALYIIISLENPEGEVKAFRISREGEIVEERFEIF